MPVSNLAPTTRERQSLGMIDIIQAGPGFSVDRLPTPRHDAPEWAFDDGFIRRLFPIDRSKWTGRILNQAACLWWYWRCGIEEKEIAWALRLSCGAVHQIVLRLRRKGDLMMQNQNFPSTVKALHAA
ncbi:MAG TPA: hypothetical protein VG206_02770 [Terriglobia bacterium]|nr:hypothetical protein [Terriglobia bacterium]